MLFYRWTDLWKASTLDGLNLIAIHWDSSSPIAHFQAIIYVDQPVKKTLRVSDILRDLSGQWLGIGRIR